MKYRPGDVLLVRATVVEVTGMPSGELFALFDPHDVRLNLQSARLNLQSLDVVSVESTRIELGDAVRRGPWKGVVLAIDGDELWVLTESGERQTWSHAGTERIN